MRYRFFMLGLMLVFTLMTSNMSYAEGGELALVRDGEAQATIVLGSDASPTEALAAQEFQEAVRLISGVELSISDTQSEGAGVRLVLGTPETNDDVAAQREAFADDFDYLAGTDGFAVRQVGDVIYIVANEPKGVLNGVFSFLEENTSILWYRAGDEGVAYQPSRTIVATKADYRERPAYDLRGWFLTYIWGNTHAGTEQWMVRNRVNYKPANRSILLKRLDSYHQRGLHSGYGGGHNQKFWFPSDPHFEEHPEYYAMIDGVRRPIEQRSQMCYSNREGAAAFAEAVLEKTKDLPESIPSVAILFEDNWNLCECDLCTQSITLPDGSELAIEDEAFRSTQYFGWLNQVAERIHEERPGLRVSTYGYFFTRTPPKIDVFNTIDVRFCPIVRSEKHALQHEINREWTQRLEGWLEVIEPEQIVVREYYGCATAFPRPIASVVASDLRYFNSLGIRKIVAETPPDMQKQVSDVYLAHRWDASAMQYWLITRLYWDPNADVDALRERYLTRVYGEAASAMGRYHELIRDAWNASDAAEHYNASGVGMAKRYIKEPGIEDACRSALEEASRSTSDETIQARVSAMRDRFESWMTELAENPAPTAAVPHATTDVSQMLDFDSGAWSSAGAIEAFDVMSQPGVRAKHPTVAYLLHDEQNLYLGILAGDPDGEVHASEMVGDFEQFPGGDRIELFFVGDQKEKGLYYQFAFNAGGVRYDGIGYDKGWNGQWSLQTRVDDDGWRAVVAIPWSTIGIDLSERREVSALIYRFVPADGETPKEHSSWNGGTVHRTEEFGRLMFE